MKYFLVAKATYFISDLGTLPILCSCHEQDTQDTNRLTWRFQVIFLFTSMQSKFYIHSDNSFQHSQPSISCYILIYVWTWNIASIFQAIYLCTFILSYLYISDNISVHIHTSLFKVTFQFNSCHISSKFKPIFLSAFMPSYNYILGDIPVHVSVMLPSYFTWYSCQRLYYLTSLF